MNLSQTGKILYIIDALDKIAWYRNLDEEDYRLIREIITSCKLLMAKSDSKEPIIEGLKQSVDEIESTFFKVSTSNENSKLLNEAI